MALKEQSLGDLREEIDRIDDALHDLIMERAAVVARVAGAKAGLAFRPAREAAILRRLVGRHRGDFPKAALVRIWRELVAASVSMQGPFSVAVYVPESDPGYWDLARDYFGTVVPATAIRSARAIVREVAAGRVSVGVVPTPVLGEDDPWWRSLVDAAEPAPRVIARMPFIDRASTSGGARPEALALALAEHEETGDDRSLLVLQCDSEVSRALLSTALGAAGLQPSLVEIRHEGADTWLVLVEVAGFVGPEDARLEALVADGKLPVRRVYRIGGYAAPFGSVRPADAG